MCSLDTSSKTSSNQPTEVPLPTIPQSNAPELDVGDFELFHHFCYFTSPSFSHVKAAQHFWSVSVPQLSFKHPFLLHAILTLAALHLGHMKFQSPRESPRDLQAKADSHWEMALKLASPLLPRVDETNSAALYLFATLTCLHTFAFGPRPGGFLLFNLDGPSEWLTFFRGIRSIEEACGLSTTQDGELRLLFSLSRMDLKGASADDLEASLQEALEELNLIITENIGEGSREYPILLEAFQLLRGCYVSVFNQPAQASAHTIFSWLHHVSDDYLNLVQKKDPVALAIFAYFVVLIKRMEGAWMVKGWPNHLISGIHACMPAAKHFWLRWPMIRIGWLPNKAD